MPWIFMNLHRPVRDCCLILDGLQKNYRLIDMITRQGSGLGKGRWRLKSKSRLYSYASEQISPGVPACGPGNIIFKIVQY
jgi:hypothetical protein